MLHQMEWSHPRILVTLPSFSSLNIHHHTASSSNCVQFFQDNNVLFPLWRQYFPLQIPSSANFCAVLGWWWKPCLISSNHLPKISFTTACLNVLTSTGLTTFPAQHLCCLHECSLLETFSPSNSPSWWPLIVVDHVVDMIDIKCISGPTKKRIITCYFVYFKIIIGSLFPQGRQTTSRYCCYQVPGTLVVPGARTEQDRSKSVILSRSTRYRYWVPLPGTWSTT